MTVLAFSAFVGCLVMWGQGGGAIDLPWAEDLGIRLHFDFDGLGALYALLATGIGAVVFAYGIAYLPLHLEAQERSSREGWRFWPWMGLFMLSMVGLATAQDLILLFVMFDLTAVCSFFLIGFDRQNRASRLAALMAMLVTGIGAVAMLIGAIVLYVDHGTFSIPQLTETLQAAATDGTLSTGATVAVGLIVIAALAKSAQVPLHFWLPRAMAAPTPVSAYLHSAAMVAAGVLVIGRVYQMVEVSQVLLDGLLVIGLASIAIGGVISLTRDGFKQVLAYSTISQYGYVVLLYGIGGSLAAGAAAFYVVAHALAKSALFLTAGTVTVTTGAKALSQVGGLWRRLPVLAVASAIAAAALSALPLTIGFFKDELFFHAASDHSTLLGVLSVVAAGLTFAYTWRFWSEIFLTRPKRPPEPGPDPGNSPPVLLVLPVVVLAVLSFVGGIFAAPVAELAGDAATATLGRATEVSVAYHLDSRIENLMALAAWTLGGLLLATSRLWGPAAAGVARLGDRFGPGHLYELTLNGLNRLSDWLHDVEIRDVRSRVTTVLVPAGILVGFALLVTPTTGAFEVGPVRGTDPILAAVLALVVIASLVTIIARKYVALVVSLAVVGLSLATVYALLDAPGVALVAVLVETVLTLTFLAIIGYATRSGKRSRREVETEDPAAGMREASRWRDAVVGAIAGVAAFLVVWASLSRPAATDSVISEQIRLAPDAHGLNVVTVILADFRGLDTMVEITVVLVAVFGVISILRRMTVS